jgi:hypothetical protein
MHAIFVSTEMRGLKPKPKLNSHKLSENRIQYEYRAILVSA